MAWWYLWHAGIPAVLFIAGVTLLLYYWPRGANVLLNRQQQEVKIIAVQELSPDTKCIRLSLGESGTILGLPTGKDIIVYAPNPAKCLESGKWNGRGDPDEGAKEIYRRYTPITGNDTPGYADIIVKIYRPGKVRMADGTEKTWEDGGKMGLYLDSKQVGDSISINGPVGIIEYLGKGSFMLPKRTLSVEKVAMLAGGSGITPMLQIVRAALQDPHDSCEFTLIYANKTESDILLREELEQLAKESEGQFKAYFTLDFPPANWKHRVGFISPEMIRSFLPPSSEKPLVLMCGPPPMVDESGCEQSLRVLGYPKSHMVTFTL